MRNSGILALGALVIAVPLAIVLGVMAALRRDGIVDHAIATFTLFSISFPEFVIGTFLILIFSTQLGFLPATSSFDPDANILENLRLLVLPIITLTLALLAHTSRMMRASLIEVLETNYVRTATLKGLPRSVVVVRHALRNALLPTVTIVATHMGAMLGAVVVVEAVFSYPGLGRLILIGVQNTDVPLLQASILIVAAAYTLGNLAADVLYAMLNPQIRY